MPDRKVIAVLGATGAQGGGLVRAILNDPNAGFAARVLTRDVNSAKAEEFAKRGAQVVAADVDDIESLKSAFQGAYGAYCVRIQELTFRSYAISLPATAQRGTAETMIALRLTSASLASGKSRS